MSAAGRLGDWPAAEAASYAFALTEADRLGNRKARKKLRAIGPPPYGVKSLLAERTWLARFDGQMKIGALWKMGRIFLGWPESSIFDLPDILRGFRFSLDAMWAEVSKLNLFEARARVADARVLLSRAKGSLGPAGDQCRVLRRIDRAVEEARLVRGVRTRALRR